MLLDIKNLHFSYSPEKPLFQNLNMQISEGKILALAGESGCGKSTLLSLIFGLYDWHLGEIIFCNKPLLGPKGNLVPGEKDMKMVSQNFDLMPYSTVFENVGKYVSNINLSIKKDIVLELLEIVGMESYAYELPKNLSGGQQQRVAIARALSLEPKLLLLDEPFSHLDFSRKIDIRDRLFSYVKAKNISMMISTHEVLEIMPWLDQIIVLQEGRIIQSGSPKESYQNPYNEYVAKLFGEVNILSDELRGIFSTQKRFLYPHQLEISENGITGTVLESRFSGSHYWNKIQINKEIIILYTPNYISDVVSIKIK